MNQENEQQDGANEDSIIGAVPMDKFRQLINELHIACLSEPSADALAKYFLLAEQIEAQPDASIWQKIKATLSWDSREHLVAQGARGANSDSYRMVYAAEQTEIEIMIESQTEKNYIEGDIVSLQKPDDLSEAQTPALVILSATTHSSTTLYEELYEVESDVDGRFRFENIDSGTYDMQLLLLNGSLIEINDIEL